MRAGQPGLSDNKGEMKCGKKETKRGRIRTPVMPCLTISFSNVASFSSGVSPAHSTNGCMSAHTSMVAFMAIKRAIPGVHFGSSLFGAGNAPFVFRWEASPWLSVASSSLFLLSVGEFALADVATGAACN